MSLQELQQKIKKSKLDALIVSRNNMFIGQDILDEENVLQKLTNFSGSKGTLLAFTNRAILFVDGRYEIQAKLEVNAAKIEVVCGKSNALNSWLMKNIKSTAKIKIGYNPWCHTIHEIERLHTFANNNFSKLKFTESNLLPSTLSHKASMLFEHKLKFAGATAEEKIEKISKTISYRGLDAYFIAAADSVSWLLNIRSDLLPNSPIIRAFALINKNGDIVVFSNQKNIPSSKNIKVLGLDKIEKELTKYKKKKINCCYHATPQKVLSLLEKNKIISNSQIDPCQVMKAEKNAVELKGTKDAHLRDGVSVSKFLYWLENNWQNKTEFDLSEKLFEFRKKNQNFFSNSFDTIAGFAENGAIVHYQPSLKNHKKLSANNILLLDSGAQYFDGTTDLTRTVAIGSKIKKEIIDNFTHVLKAQIALNSAIFPVSTSGMTLDALARNQLWQHGLTYNHGTGHGVGHFLNVHEGPQNIASAGAHYALRENMVNSIEPGFYKEGAYGIRIENLVYVAKSKFAGFLEFVNLTLVPIDKRLISVELLNKDEILWLNNYHAEVYKKISAHLNEGEKKWLKKSCLPL